MSRAIVVLTLLTVFPWWFPLSAKPQIQPKPRRLSTHSPWFPVNQSDVELHESYSGWDIQNQERFSRLTIEIQAKQMIAQAQSSIVVSMFLFDNLYSKTTPPWDLVRELTNLLVWKKKQNPKMPIAVIFDPINKAYADRMSESTRRFLENVIDIFYSDLVSTKPASRLGIVQGLRRILRAINLSTDKIPGWVFSRAARLKIPFVPFEIDGDRVSWKTLFNAALLKANHRKVLVIDGNTENAMALVGSANAHNASLPSTNFAVSAKGAVANYIYMVLREDIRQSLLLDQDYVAWSKTTEPSPENYLQNILPPIAEEELYKSLEQQSIEDPAWVAFVTETEIKREILRMLRDANGDDEVRFQMFYLSDVEILEELLNAASRVANPIRGLLDPSKDALGKIKDGSPNRQVAAYLMRERNRSDSPLNLAIRWYSTHGEQNHAKSMSVTNPRTGKYEYIGGSANWTRKNLDGINMESDFVLKNAKGIVSKFNSLFDMFWDNPPGIEYSVAYDDPRFGYNESPPMWKWARQKRRCLGLLRKVDESTGRPILQENALVGW